jgi:flagellar biogenesis protein FliO
MIGEFVARLAVVLPLVCVLAAACLWALKRGGLKGGPWLRVPIRTEGDKAQLEVLDVRAISPMTRLAVVRFDGRVHLLGVAGQTISLLMPARDPIAAPDAKDVL